jgi:catechol 2,3-dioxygenase-like lactoylglutathione lyase family enzyme
MKSSRPFAKCLFLLSVDWKGTVFMPTRFDHAVIAVRDLDSATQQFQRLGFDAQPGGRHTGRGTHNALVRFGLDYFELLSVYDEEAARAGNPRGLTILDSLHGREAALVGYALATTNIEQDAQRFRGAGSDLPLPNAMQRTRPDGQTLSWRTLSPGGASWNRPWPFLIQWDIPDEQRLQVDQPGTHANGAVAWTRVAVATRDLDSTLDVYQNQLGLEVISRDTHQGTHLATLSVGKGTIQLLAPEGKGHIQQIITAQGEGPFALSFTVKSLQQTRTFLEQQGIKFTHKTGEGEKLVLDPGETYGIGINFLA